MKLHSSSSNSRAAALALFVLSPLTVGMAMAADVVVVPSAASSFVVKDSTGATDRFRVTEAGAVSVLSVPTAATKAIALCVDAVGVLGPCAANAGFSLPYAATVNNAATLFDITQSGTGGALRGSVSNAAGTGDALRAEQAGLGRAVYGSINNTSNIVAAVRGETNGGGYGVFGQATGNGTAGFFQISNPASTSSTANVTTNGIGSGVTIQLSNASNGARGVDVLQAGVGPGVFSNSAGGTGVWGITGSISAAGVIGDNAFGEAVVGRGGSGCHPTCNGIGAVVGRHDGDGGYGVRGFHTKAGIGVLGQAGISGGTAVAGRFENVNAANASDVLVSAGNGTGIGLVVTNSNPGTPDLAVFRKGGNVARIDSTGKGFFNGGTQTGGADVAELIPHVGRMPVPGDVVMIDVDNPMHYRVADEANSAAVAGVITTKPGVLMNAGVEDVGEAPALALVGRVPVKVTDEAGSIRAGDLLVSSSTPGHAMKAPAQPAAGTIVGKALQAHVQGAGKVEMLVMLR